MLLAVREQPYGCKAHGLGVGREKRQGHEATLVVRLCAWVGGPRVDLDQPSGPKPPNSTRLDLPGFWLTCSDGASTVLSASSVSVQEVIGPIRHQQSDLHQLGRHIKHSVMHRQGARRAVVTKFEKCLEYRRLVRDGDQPHPTSDATATNTSRCMLGATTSRPMFFLDTFDRRRAALGAPLGGHDFGPKGPGRGSLGLGRVWWTEASCWDLKFSAALVRHSACLPEA